MQDNMKPAVMDATGGAVGKYKVQLFDNNTGDLVEETEWHNMINPAFGALAYHSLYLAVPFTNSTQLQDIINYSGADSMQSGYASTLSLVNTSMTPESFMHGFPEGNTLCKTNLFKADLNESPHRANVNLGESFNKIEFNEQGKAVYRRHIVVDYSTHQGNGTFNSFIISCSGLPNYKTLGDPTTSTNNEYHDKSIGKVPRMQINKNNIGTSESGYSDSGTTSVEAPGIFWTCNSSGKFKKTASSATQDNNWDHLTFYRFDVTEGNLKFTRKVKLSGTPAEFLDNLGVYNYQWGVYLKGKFYVCTDYTGNNCHKKLYIFDSSGAYEKSITWPSSSSSDTATDVGYGYLHLSYSSFCALPNCIIENRFYSTNTGGGYLNIYGVDGAIVKQLSRSDFRDVIYNMYIKANNKPDYAINNILTYGVRFVPMLMNSGKIVAVMIYGDTINQELGYYDPDKNDFVAFDNGLTWNFQVGLSSMTGGKYIHKSNAYTIDREYIHLEGAVPWWSWCKLPKSVTKTSSTTMKVQYDIVMDVVPPFSPALEIK